LHQAAHGTGVIEELLNLRWDLSQLHCAKAAESVLLLLRQDDVVVPIVGCTLTVCFFAIFCQPFVVFCQRDVGDLVVFSMYCAAFARYCLGVNIRRARSF
jgi:hypothetical protein